jgi:hypothetical protein
MKIIEAKIINGIFMPLKGSKEEFVEECLPTS